MIDRERTNYATHQPHRRVILDRESYYGK